MSNELTRSEKGTLAVLQEKELSEIIKPLSHEIHLFDSFVSGVLQMKDSTVLEKLKPEEKLVLQRKETLFDSNTIEIYTEQGVRIGYIPEKDNVIFARLLDAGKLLIARITDIDVRRSVPLISIGIYLVDY